MLEFMYSEDYDDNDVNTDPGASISLPVPRRTSTKAERKELYRFFHVPKGKNKYAKLRRKFDDRKAKREAAAVRQAKIIKNAQVFAIASKYDIEPLKRKAKEKFDSVIKPQGMPTDFSAVLSVVYNSTPESEAGLRETMVWKGLNNHFWLQKDGELQRNLYENMPFAVELLKQVSNSHVTTNKAMKRAAAESLETAPNVANHKWPWALGPSFFWK